ncbi:MAG: M24 family metallopeptidase [Thermoplasmata archaeon]
MDHIIMRRRALSIFLNGRKFLFLPEDRYVTKISRSKSFTYLIVDGNDFIFIIHEAQDDSSLANERNIVTMDPESELLSIVSGDKVYSMHDRVNSLKTDFLDPSPAFRKPFDDEIPLIREGFEKMVRSFNDSLDMISIGKSEREIRAEIDYRLIRNGFDDFVFSTVVSSGIRSSVPLSRTGERVIEKGDVIIVDMSALYKGYEISISRVLFTEINDDLKKIWDFYNGVFEISSRNFYQGKRCGEIDSIAREYLGSGGYSYPHYTGYPAAGFSSPYIFPESNDYLERNSVFIFSPGIYVKGRYGFRVKRAILIGDHGFTIMDE